MTKKELLEAIDEKLKEIYQQANDLFAKDGDYYGFQEGLEYIQKLIENS